MERQPFVTWILVAANTAVAAFVVGFFPGPEDVLPFAWSAETMARGAWSLLVASMFVHANLLHLFVNMMTLLSFGPLFEEKYGPARFLLLYFVSGLVGGVVHAEVSAIPGVGASGALFGLIGALLMIQPTSNVSIFFIPISVVRAAALYVAVLAFVPEFSTALPIAHGAHVGGMVAGMAFAVVLDARRAARHIPGILGVFLSVAGIVAWFVRPHPGLGEALRAGAWGDVLDATWPLIGAVILGAAAFGYLERSSGD
ncbi:MAG: rhomboid family intramembrane serine protease [Methanobacteriota archaeon]